MTSTTGPTTTPAHTNRRLRTRAALLRAARELLAEGRSNASIEEITKLAGVGFGSFFNHFPQGKDELFTEAILDLLDVYTLWIREVTDGLDDPAEVFARSFRLTGRLALAQPGLLAPLVARGSDYLFTDRGLRQKAVEDLSHGMATGRFIEGPVIVHLVSVGSVLLGLVNLAGRHGQPDVPPIDIQTVDAMAEGALRLLGLEASDAAEMCARDLPEVQAPKMV